MRSRQTIARQWMIIPGAVDRATRPALRRLPRGSGILLLQKPMRSKLRHVRRVARLRGLELVVEGRRTAARVHGVGELRRALLRRIPMILLSPLFETQSHPAWKPLPRMRAAALARLAGPGVVALGGMNAQRYAHIAPLGFVGWAGISAFRT